MKNLKTYITEAIKPPRLSAKNKHLWSSPRFTKEEVIKWLRTYNNNVTENDIDIVGGKINVYTNIGIHNKYIEYLPYPFGIVKGFFCLDKCYSLKSLKNSPQKAGRYFSCDECSQLTSLEGAPKEVGSDFFLQQLWKGIHRRRG